jgi:pimeloyl-ACP methyl ester carboxylesterase
MIQGMEPKDPRRWIPRLGAVTLGAVILLLGTMTWSYSNELRDRLVAIDTEIETGDAEIVTVGSGRITVARTDQTVLEGIWGVEGPNGYGQASVVITVTDETVERAFRTLEGEFAVGEVVSFDPIAYPGDPFEAHNIEFEEVRFTGDLGVYPAWVIDNDRDTWVVILHGGGPEQRAEALRIVPALVAERYPVMVMTVRGDDGAPATRTGFRTLGATEWRDLASAVGYGSAQNADRFVLVGLDSGASTVANYLHEADDIGIISGVVFDSALFDPERIADRIAAARNLPAPLRGAGKLLASIRFDIDWNELDQVDRAGEYTKPVLVMHGAADSVVDPATAREFSELLGDLATLVEFPGGRHGQLWNADPPRYEDELLRFIERVREG